MFYAEGKEKYMEYAGINGILNDEWFPRSGKKDLEKLFNLPGAYQVINNLADSDLVFLEKNGISVDKITGLKKRKKIIDIAKDRVQKKDLIKIILNEKEDMEIRIRALETIIKKRVEIKFLEDILEKLNPQPKNLIRIVEEYKKSCIEKRVDKLSWRPLIEEIIDPSEFTREETLNKLVRITNRPLPY